MEENNKEKSTIGIAGFVLGIISILSALFWYITLPSGILAIIFGAKSVKRIGSKLGKAGMILGIVGLSIICIYIYKHNTYTNACKSIKLLYKNS